MRFPDLVKVDLLRRRQFHSVTLHIQHLPRANIFEFFGIFDQAHPRVALQHNQVGVTKTGRLQDHGGPGNAHCDRARSELGPAGILGHAQKNRAALQFAAASGLVEAENRVRAQTRDGQVLKGKFRARFIAGPHARVFGYLIVWEGGSWRGSGWQQLNVANDLRDARLLFRRIGRDGIANEKYRSRD